MNQMRRFFPDILLIALICMPVIQQATHAQDPASIAGVAIIPHRVEESMRFRRPRDPSLAARVQMFVQGSALPKSFDGKSPAELLAAGEWAWHDMVTTVKPPDGAMTVWTFNGKSSR